MSFVQTLCSVFGMTSSDDSSDVEAGTQPDSRVDSALTESNEIADLSELIESLKKITTQSDPSITSTNADISMASVDGGDDDVTPSLPPPPPYSNSNSNPNSNPKRTPTPNSFPNANPNATQNNFHHFRGLFGNAQQVTIHGGSFQVIHGDLHIADRGSDNGGGDFVDADSDMDSDSDSDSDGYYRPNGDGNAGSDKFQARIRAREEHKKRIDALLALARARSSSTQRVNPGIFFARPRGGRREEMYDGCEHARRATSEDSSDC
ncbi:hypothetical protein BDN70DRAFT_878328 [Pholiota conissans]|uniref:Uncharacterized protein n=1 Tax=Pholiota conissans TaxID=109636 RepID=A0A9P6D154_9AGAR|nr:hypothetical protein BDN70DRAFT_878328 [Pholiota conissans]